LFEACKYIKGYIRRSCATRNQKNGSLKDVQSHLGHSNIQTTGNTYIQEIPASVIQIVNSDVTDVLCKPPKKKAANVISMMSRDETFMLSEHN
jgi:hypothetical protein